MIRLNRHQNGIRRLSRRHRVSNQLAAFAAIMLFASTQLDAPGGNDSDHPAGELLARQVMMEPEASSDPAPEAESGSITETALGSRKKARGLNLSLFLLRR